MWSAVRVWGYALVLSVLANCRACTAAVNDGARSGDLLVLTVNTSRYTTDEHRISVRPVVKSGILQ